MEDPRLEEILNRLDAMERALDELRDHRARDDRGSREGHRGHGCGCHEHRRAHREHGCGCHEHRRAHREHGCRCERQDHVCGCQGRRCDCRPWDSRGPEDGQAFHEKRVVDLIVRLVTERVDELLWRHRREQEKPVPSQQQDRGAGSMTDE